jgi:hypothetical protein
MCWTARERESWFEEELRQTEEPPQFVASEDVEEREDATPEREAERELVEA